MTRRIRAPLAHLLSLPLLLSLFSPSARSADAAEDLDRRLASTKSATVTIGDFRADLVRLPEELRGQVLVSERRVASVVQNLLKAKTLAAEARKLGLDKDPINARAIALGTDRVLTALYYDYVNAKARKEFDANIEAHTRRAADIYRVKAEQYFEPERVHAAHILIDAKKRGREEALALAQKLRVQIAAGADFAVLAKEHSDDPGSKAQGGDLGFFEAKTMVKGFAEEAFRLSAKEPLSAPVETRFGFHIIKFIDRKPARTKTFDEVKGAILAELKQQFAAEALTEHQREFLADASLEVDEKALDSLHLKLTPEMLRAAAANPEK